MAQPKSSVFSNGDNDRKRFAREVNQSAKRSCFHQEHKDLSGLYARQNLFLNRWVF